MISDNTFAAIDIGNTQVKILYRKKSISFSYKENWVENVFSFLKSENEIFVGVSSVQPKMLLELQEKSKTQASIFLISLETYIRHATLLIDLSAIEGMGMDRILGLYGALGYASPPLITIDCGTAITINVVQRDYRCLGGAILPGVATQLRALHHFTGQLPVVEPVSTNASVGVTTQQAMALGAVRGAFGAIKEIVGRVMEDVFPSEQIPPVFLTGGDALLLQKEMERWNIHPVYLPDLVREGIISVTQTLVERGIIQE